MTNLFTYPVAKGKTDTSEFAGKITEKGAGPLREQVYYAVKMGGTLGLTSSEIADVVCRDYAGVQPRTSELASLGYLKDSAGGPLVAVARKSFGLWQNRCDRSTQVRDCP